MIDLIKEGEEDNSNGIDFIELLIKGRRNSLKFIKSYFY